MTRETEWRMVEEGREREREGGREGTSQMK